VAARSAPHARSLFVEGEPNEAEKATIAQLVAFNEKGTGYSKIQSTRPQTIGYALADSPAGQAAWIYEKLGEWTDSNHEPEREISRDEMLDNISLYWLTDTPRPPRASTMRVTGPIS
jgi:hypothetical protein